MPAMLAMLVDPRGYHLFSLKIGKTPKMDGENNGKPPLKMDDLEGKPTIFGNIHIDPAIFGTIPVGGKVRFRK